MILRETITTPSRLNLKLQRVLNLLLALSCSLVLVPIFLLIETLRQLVAVTLTWSDPHFVRLLHGPDSVWAKVSTPAAKCTVGVLIIAEHDDGAQLLHRVRDRIESRHLLYPESTFLLRQCLGFFYYARAEEGRIVAGEHVVPLGEYDTEQDFQDALARVSNADMPLDNTLLWEIYVGQTPMRWRGPGRQYPILFRMHHSMGDGIALLNLFVDMFADDGNAIVRRIFNEMNGKIRSRNRTVSPPSWYDRAVRLWTRLITLRAKSVLVESNQVFRRRGKLSGDKHVALRTEKFGSGYVSKVKQMKHALDVSFSDVIMSAVAASFADYYERTNSGYQSVTASLVVMLGAMDAASEIVTRRDGRVHVRLNNKFTSGNLRFPIKKLAAATALLGSEAARQSLASNSAAQAAKATNGRPRSADVPTTSGRVSAEELIRDMNRESVALREAIDFAYNEWQLNIPTPTPITQSIMAKSLGPIILSSLPGCHRLKVLGGYDVHDMVFWVPNMLWSGIGVSIQTYDDRFQLGLIADKVAIENKMEVNRILEDVFKYVDIFYNDFCLNRCE